MDDYPSGPTFGQIHLFADRKDSKPYMTHDQPIHYTLGPVLQDLADGFSPIKSK